jgi:hypothetical protein
MVSQRYHFVCPSQKARLEPMLWRVYAWIGYIAEMDIFCQICYIEGTIGDEEVASG